MRADKALVELKIFLTRTKAQQAIKDGIVTYQGQVITKPGTDISDTAQLSIVGEIMPYVSRGGLKLEKALHHFQIDLKGKTVLDIGSSTGGFSDCALQHGAKHIIAIDTGTNQMDSQLRQDKRISLFEQTDFRSFPIEKMSKAQVAVIDISFLSVTKILKKLASLQNIQEVICLIKPQFECGKEIADKYKGVVLNQQVHIDILNNLILAFQQNGFFIQGLTFSPITGGSGNIEYLAYFSHQAQRPFNIEQKVQQAFQKLK
ncbi:MAG: TlyA family RNA methyltransferase [Alphaproteobacteria bacterium]|nr:TlyA family RNA methyltransferase [Alphaproteobacteria bacterium]